MDQKCLKNVRLRADQRQSMVVQLRQENLKFKTSLGYIDSLSKTKQTQKDKKDLCHKIILLNNSPSTFMSGIFQETHGHLAKL
jgi:hypothetical protein